jgi:hypothetical protein
MAAATAPGWNATGTKITDPVAFVESILRPFLPEETEEIPTYEKLEDLSYTGGLIIEHSDSIYQYQTLPSLNLTRIGANGNGNCWFDSFLFSLSPSYRTCSTSDRAEISSKFRGWCGQRAKQILDVFPKSIRTHFETYYLETFDTFVKQIQTNKSELTIYEGFFVAWFFGVNCIYFKQPGPEDNDVFQPICETMFQSPSCKVICIAWLGNHYEPLVDATFLDDTLDEEQTTTLFSWDDRKLCASIQSSLTTCSQAERGLMYAYPWKVTCAAAGGRSRARRRRRSTRKPIRRRKATRKARKTLK